MIDMKNVNRCKDCGQYPKMLEINGWIKLKCYCGRSSSSRNIEQTKRDWNYYHGINDISIYDNAIDDFVNEVKLRLMDNNCVSYEDIIDIVKELKSRGNI